jgi:gamma-glutamylcyclotransferase (GGCT)/AIG2-like uncharacterized protein YtfP
MSNKQKIKPRHINLHQRVLYFSYGSNLSHERLHYRVGQTVNKGIYRLQNYKLVFDTGLNCSFANIIFSKDSHVDGVIYEMSYEQLLQLDKYEGLYKRFYIELEEGELAGRKLHFYISPFRRREFKEPLTREYYNAIHNGAIQNNLLELASYMESNVLQHVDAPLKVYDVDDDFYSYKTFRRFFNW